MNKNGKSKVSSCILHFSPSDRSTYLNITVTNENFNTSKKSSGESNYDTSNKYEETRLFFVTLVILYHTLTEACN